MMLSLLISIGLIFSPSVLAQEEEKDTLYYKIKDLVELEIVKDRTELVIERFTSGIFYDKKLETIVTEGGSEKAKQMEIKTDYVDMSLVKDIIGMCGDGGESGNEHKEHITCLQAQEIIKNLIDRNGWHRTLGRDLQAIASGYEVGIEGYPGKPVDAIMRMSSIAQLWRAANDPFTQPFLETLTRAEPWPEDEIDTIESKLQSIVDSLEDYIRESGDGDDRKEDDSEMVAAVWRYKDGVNYIINKEGECDSSAEPSDVDRMWLEKRWCSLEEDLLDVLENHVLAEDIEKGNDEFIIFPSFVDKENNMFIWIRDDDIGLQWFVPIEPVQAALYHPDYGDCLDGDSVKSCYDSYQEDKIIRGGQYPLKQDGTGLRPGGSGLFSGDLNPPRDSDEDSDGNPLPPEGLVVPQPKETEGICSHPFSKRGYLCRAIESEACDLTEKDNEELNETGTGGIVLTRCQPERFKDDIARRVSGEDICGIGGWREEVEENMTEDTPDEDEDITPNQCAACAIDIVCKDNCYDDPDLKGKARTSKAKRDGVIEVCIPTSIGAEEIEYLMAHELVHAQQMCADSNIQTAERLGYNLPKPEQPAACCALEREAYFMQCKLLALDSVLDKVGITIDQCASALSNFSCKEFDEDPDDDDYVCTNDGVDPQVVYDLVTQTTVEMLDQLDLPATCEDAMKGDRVKSIRNSIPLACKPGCQARYVNTIGNNLCYTGQCLEETHEWSVAISGKSALTTNDQAYPWNACEETDPNIGQFAVPPAITSPRFPLYRPEYLLKQLDDALCQINGLPARTPPVLCGFNEEKVLNLPPLNFLQSTDELAAEPDMYSQTALGIQYAAPGMGSRIANEMFTQYLRISTRNLSELLEMSHRLFNEVGEISFPATMCPRYMDGNLCDQLQ